MSRSKTRTWETLPGGLTTTCGIVHWEIKPSNSQMVTEGVSRTEAQKKPLPLKREGSGRNGIPEISILRWAGCILKRTGE